ncbi:MAG TPA: choice-of-anchor tandem repeat GloVer-containing protein, partial [Rhizomicrobium sp.]|nr:choice-of-anchor tandem repeat GloVer-containing protein [Rhizomicrobium sp.]
MGKAVLYGLAVALAMPGALTSAQAAHQRFHLLYTFHGADGGNPVAAPILDQDGNLYGTTEGGGPLNKGAVYKLAPDGNE